MLRALGIYSVLFFIIAVMFLLDRSYMIDDTKFYLGCGIVIGIALLAALSKTIKQRRENKLMTPPLKNDDEIQS